MIISKISHSSGRRRCETGATSRWDLARVVEATAARTEAAAADLDEDTVAAGADGPEVGVAAEASVGEPPAGRSFFVDLLRDRVARLTSGAAVAATAGSGVGPG